MPGSFNNINQGSFNNINQGSFNNINQGSFSSVGGSKPKEPKSGINLQGSLLDNFGDNSMALGAGLTTLIGGLLGFDKEGRQAIENIVGAAKGDSEKAKGLADALLSTYNITLNDLGKMPLGELAGNVIEGIWQHPLDAALDFTTIKGLIKPGKAAKLTESELKNIKNIQKSEFLVREAEELTKNNVRLNGVGKELVDAITNIEKKYTPEIISKGMQAIETLGFRQAPKELRAVMQDLTKANDIYKQFTKMAGAELLDDADMAARELLAKEYHVPFEALESLSKNTKLYQDALRYVVDNDVRPLFHLKPKIYDIGSTADAEKLATGLLKRTYGTIDYASAAERLGDKAADFVNKVVSSEVIDTPNKINAKIREVNKLHKKGWSELDTGGLFKNQAIKDLNKELKKVMLSTGTYLGANVITTTLSILNNFDANALRRTIKNAPKFRMVELHEAKTPWLQKLSQFNNKLYRPAASVDRWLEEFASEYIKNVGVDKAKYMQSMIPSKVVVTNPILRLVKDLVPFGSYPAAAMQEVGANVSGKPLKSLLYNQVNKIGQEANIQAQEMLGIEPDRTKAIRLNDKGEQISRSIIVTPIQAANMFLLGQQGDAIQIPVIQFLNQILTGGSADNFTVGNKKYKVDKGIVETEKGKFNLLPALSYVGRKLVGPVAFYNDVLVPLLSDKYVRDEKQLFNTMVSESQYSNLNKANQRKVIDKARERLGKRILGTYEYRYYNPDKYISKSVKRQVRKKYRDTQQMKKVLRSK